MNTQKLSTAALTTALTTAVVVLLCACESGGNRVAAPGDRDGDTLLSVRDFDGAVRVYEQELRAEPDSPVLQEKLRTARRLAAQQHAIESLRLAARGDGEGAARELAYAQRLGPDVPSVRRAAAQVLPRLEAAKEAARLRAEARELMPTDPERAAQLAARARKLEPDSHEASALQRQAALQMDAERSATRAAELWRAGQREDAVRELVRAEVAGKRTRSATSLAADISATLLAEINSGDENDARAAWRLAVQGDLGGGTSGVLRAAFTHRLLAQARQLAAAGRTATAALLEIEAVRAGSDAPTPSLDAVRTEVALLVHVSPFEDKTDGLVDGRRLAHALADRLEEDASHGGVLLRAVVADAAPPAGLLVTGDVTSQSVRHMVLGVERRPIEYTSDVRLEPNPDVDEVGRYIADLDQELARVKGDLRRANDEAARIRDIIVRRDVSRPRQGEIIYELRLAEAEARVVQEQQRVRSLEEERLFLSERLRSLPAQREIPIRSQGVHEVTNARVSAELRVHARVTEGTRTLLDEEVIGHAHHDESIAAAFPKANILADPDDSPDDAELAARAVDQLHSVLAQRIRAAAEVSARRILVEAREAEGAGDSNRAAELYSRYLLTTPEVPTPQRADAARAVLELAGVHVALRATPQKELR